MSAARAMSAVWGVSACVLGALAAATLASACASEEIVLATLPAAVDGGTAPKVTRCVDGTECTASAFCSRHDCADVAGTCELLPVICDEEGAPVCGCDGITYWNDCLRRTAGITAMRPGLCPPETAVTCGKGGKGGPPVANECPTGLFCSRLLSFNGPPDFCPPDVPGSCWALPAVCPDRAGPDRWIACGPSSGACSTTCDAIRTGERHKRANACP